MARKLFHVTFTRLGNKIPYEYTNVFEATEVGALEAPIQEFVNEVFGDENTTVVVLPDVMEGSLNYGLLGNFKIVEM